MSEKVFTPHTYASGDFMLGDFIYVIERDGRSKQVVKINSLTNRKVGYINPQTRQEEYVRNCEKRIQPIPLMEWYDFRTNGCLHILFDKDFFIEVDKNVVVIADHKTKNTKMFSRKSNEEIFIHDIQHMLNLSREEKKFKLKKI